MGESGHARRRYLVRRGDERPGILDPASGEFSSVESDAQDADWSYGHVFGEADRPDAHYLEALDRLGQAMLAGDPVERPDSAIPAAYTYLAQFALHDLTYFDATSGVPRSLRSPALDFDSVPPTVEPAAADTNTPATVRPWAVGCTHAVNSSYPRLPEDLPRGKDGVPHITDDRNDDFLQLAQTHLAFIKFFNAVARWHGFGCNAYDEARTWQVFVEHCQSVILLDLLARLVPEDIHADVLNHGRRVVCTTSTDFDIPIEFALAAGRFGHAMVRDEYPGWNAASAHMSHEHFWKFSHRNRAPNHVEGPMRGLPLEWIADWTRLADFSGTPMGGSDHLAAKRIGTKLPHAFGRLPGQLTAPRSDLAPFNLASLTLTNGAKYRIQPAQEVVRCMNERLPAPGITPLTAGDLVTGASDAVRTVFRTWPELLERTPLWYYVLKEAELGPGDCLGPVGGRIVMESFHVAIEQAGHTILPAARWQPQLPCVGGRFGFTDLLAFAGNPAPLS